MLAPLAALGAQDDPVAGLFTPVAAEKQQIGDSRPDPLAQLLDPDRRDPKLDAVETLRDRSVAVDLLQLAAAREALAKNRPATLRLNLFSDVDLGVVMERAAETRYGWSLSGRIEGDPLGRRDSVVRGHRGRHRPGRCAGGQQRQCPVHRARSPGRCGHGVLRCVRRCSLGRVGHGQQLFGRRGRHGTKRSGRPLPASRRASFLGAVRGGEAAPATRPALGALD